jgi:large subunit ribosomal protein L4
MSTTLRGPIKKERPAPVERTVERKDVAGTVLGTVSLDPELFGIEPNEAVLHQVITAQLAARRAGTQSTKTRAEVSGGGVKPWRQKGTGRARQGSIRAPQWVGGGVALGPKPRSYEQRTPKKMIRLALRSALSDRAAEGKVALVDRFGFEVPKTKDALAALRALGLEGTVLVVLAPEEAAAAKSFANLPEVQVVAASELNAYDVVRNDWLVFTDATLPTSAAKEVA